MVYDWHLPQIFRQLVHLDPEARKEGPGGCAKHKPEQEFYYHLAPVPYGAGPTAFQMKRCPVGAGQGYRETKCAQDCAMVTLIPASAAVNQLALGPSARWPKWLSSVLAKYA